MPSEKGPYLSLLVPALLDAFIVLVFTDLFSTFLYDTPHNSP